MSSHNLTQCLAEIDKDAAALEQAQLAKIRKGAMEVLRHMVFELSPVKTGFYRASHDLMVNAVSKYRRRGKDQAKSGKMVPQAQQQMKKAHQRLNKVRTLREMTVITIANNAPHCMFVETGNFGRSRKAPHGVYNVAERYAQMKFEEVARELR